MDRDSAAGFLEAVEQLRKGRPHLELRVNGPLPPYSFVEPGPAEPAGTQAARGVGVVMGLSQRVVLLPFAPVRGSGWVIGQVLREAERIYYDPATIRAELARLEEQLEAGEITEEEFDRQEDELLDRMEIGRAAARRTGNGTAG